MPENPVYSAEVETSEEEYNGKDARKNTRKQGRKRDVQEISALGDFCRREQGIICSLGVMQ